MDWKEKLIQKYRKVLGCKNLDFNVCWCEVCTSIEKIINATIKHIKDKI
jgi:hypothetical protein